MQDSGKDTASLEPFDVKRQLQVFLGEAEVFDGYYIVELAQGGPPDSIEAQVCRIVRYRYKAENEIGDDPVRQFLIPKTTEVHVGISAPPRSAFCC